MSSPKNWKVYGLGRELDLFATCTCSGSLTYGTALLIQPGLEIDYVHANTLDVSAEKELDEKKTNKGQVIKHRKNGSFNEELHSHIFQAHTEKEQCCKGKTYEQVSSTSSRTQRRACLEFSEPKGRGCFFKTQSNSGESYQCLSGARRDNYEEQRRREEAEQRVAWLDAARACL